MQKFGVVPIVPKHIVLYRGTYLRVLVYRYGIKVPMLQLITSDIIDDKTSLKFVKQVSLSVSLCRVMRLLTIFN